MTELSPADLACLDALGNSVYVMPGGPDDEFITIAVRDDNDAPEGVHDDGAEITEVFTRGSCRQLIDLEPVDAIRLARFLLDYATDMLDSGGDDEDAQ